MWQEFTGEVEGKSCLVKGILRRRNTIIRMFVSRTFLRELELYTDCPELVGRCFLQRVSELLSAVQQRGVNPTFQRRFLKSFPSSDDRPADL